MITIKQTSTILFAVLLTGLMHLTSAVPLRQDERNNFRDRNLLRMIEQIRTVDPIGFNDYLTKNELATPSIQSVAEFLAVMNQRKYLLDMKTNDSCFEIFDSNKSGTIHDIAQSARHQIASEFVPLSEDTINLFTDLVTMKRPRSKMYRVGTKVDDYEEYSRIFCDDVQILYGDFSKRADYWAKLNVTKHAVCVYYKANHNIVYIFDSIVDNKLDARQLAIIRKLYPNIEGIVYERNIALQDDLPTCAIFAITYASMLLEDINPIGTLINLNKVYGDETLYMRMHILNMLANYDLPSFGRENN